MTDQKTTETPLSDAEACNPHNLCLENSRAEYAGKHSEVIDEVVPASFARSLEKKLTASKLREAELAKALKAICAAFHMPLYGEIPQNIGDHWHMARAALQSPASQNNPKETKA